MAKEKLYAGAKLRGFRRKLTLTQREFSQKLNISLPYLNQMENNNRPLSATVILGLAEVFGFDVAELSSGDSSRLVNDMTEALADP
ncbi:MAG: helix-turn-helix domain-containing protein, partial [Planktomarina sp.]